MFEGLIEKPKRKMWIQNGGVSENEKQGPFDIVFESVFLFSIFNFHF